MKKKITILIISITSLVIIYFTIFIIQNNFLKKSFEKNYISLSGQHILNSELERCNYNIFNPEIVKITEYKESNEKDMSFYKPKNLFSQTKEEWRNSRTGGTTIENTTFNNLLKMVKEDCYQFQDGSEELEKTNIVWTYTPKRPEKTEEEIRQEQLEEEEFNRALEAGEIEIETRTLEELKEARRKSAKEKTE